MHAGGRRGGGDDFRGADGRRGRRASARAVARGHLGWHGPGWRALRLRSVCHVVVGRRGGVGGERGWERGALHDPIVYNDSCVFTWLGGSSSRGRFGDMGVSVSASSIAARAAAGSERGRVGARSMTLSVLLIVDPF